MVEKIYQDMEDSRLRYRLSDLHRIAMTVEACGGDPTAFWKVIRREIPLI